MNGPPPSSCRSSATITVVETYLLYVAIVNEPPSTCKIGISCHTLWWSVISHHPIMLCVLVISRLEWLKYIGKGQSVYCPGPVTGSVGLRSYARTMDLSPRSPAAPGHPAGSQTCSKSHVLLSHLSSPDLALFLFCFI